MSKAKEKSKAPVLHTLYKENGKKVEVADSSLEYALNLGWTKDEPKSKK